MPLTGDALDDALLGMMHQCASELCLTAPQMIRQTQLQVVTEVQSIDWKEKRAFHLTKVEEKIADIVESVAEVRWRAKEQVDASETSVWCCGYGAARGRRTEVSVSSRTDL